MGGINGNRNTGSGRYTLNMMVDIFLGKYCFSRNNTKVDLVQKS